MRPFEILTLILVSGSMVALLTHKKKKVFLYLLFSSIIFTLLQHFIEGGRWQLTLLIYLLPAMYIIYRYENIRGLNIAAKIVLPVWLLLAILLPWVIPIFTLPYPGGNYNIGTETFHWVDSLRPELFTPENNSDVREIMVQAWYPAEVPDSINPETYLDHIDYRAATIAAAGKIPSFFPQHLEYITTNSHKNVPFIGNDSLAPILIFSHGITGSRHLHQAMFEYLASRGFIVFAPDHSFDANLTIFPDGHIANYRSDITGHPDSINIRKMQIKTRSSDISFIIDQLESIQSGDLKSTLTGNIDLNTIAVGGHSYGGATATVASHNDPRIKACVVLDSWFSPVPDKTIESGIQVPFLFMGRPTWEESDYPDNYLKLDRLLANSPNPKYRLIIKKTQHLDYTDAPLFSPIISYVLEIGPIPASTSIPLMNQLTYGFLRKHLGPNNGKQFDSLLQHNPFIQY